MNVSDVLIEGASLWPLKRGQLGHRFLLAVVADLFRPVKETEMHSRLFPEEAFNPLSSPARVRKIARRVRDGLRRAGLPLELTLSRGRYRLLVPPGMALRIPVQRPAFDLLDALEKLFEQGQCLTVRDVAEQLKINRFKAARLVHQACRDQRLSYVGSGRSSRYCKAPRSLG